MKVVFTRHGETRENADGIVMGQGIAGVLNDVGLRQTEKLAQRLSKEKFHYIYVSDLKRALDTAQEIRKFHQGTRLIITPELRECNFGIYEGGPRDRLRQDMKELSLPFHKCKPEQGESYEELQQRAKTFFQKITEKHRNHNVLIVSHSSLLTMLYLYLVKRPLTLEEYEKYKPGNTAVTIGEFDKQGECTITCLNC